MGTPTRRASRLAALTLLVAAPALAQVCLGLPHSKDEHFTLGAEARARGFDAQSVGPAVRAIAGPLDLGLRYAVTHLEGWRSPGHSAELRLTLPFEFEPVALCASMGVGWNYGLEPSVRGARLNELIDVFTLELIGVTVSPQGEGDGVFPFGGASAVYIVDRSALYNRDTIERINPDTFDVMVEAGVGARLSHVVARLSVRLTQVVVSTLAWREFGMEPLKAYNPMAVLTVGGTF